jgi:uncharacterized protein
VSSNEPSGNDPAPGWYPDPSGANQQRWWDGTRWTDDVAPSGGTAPGVGGAASGDSGLALVTHLLGLLTGFLGPLVIWLVKKDSPFVEQHAREALNFQITVLLAYVISGVLVLIVVGIVGFLVVFVLDIVFSIQQMIKASREEPANYPLSIRFVT